VTRISWFPAAVAFAITCSISHGERNCPFLMLTGFPAAATAATKSVWRQRNAGTCSTSATCAAARASSGECTSVSTGTPSEARISASSASPASSPGPGGESPELRLALS